MRGVRGTTTTGDDGGEEDCDSAAEDEVGKRMADGEDDGDGGDGALGWRLACAMDAPRSSNRELGALLAF